MGIVVEDRESVLDEVVPGHLHLFLMKFAYFETFKFFDLIFVNLFNF